MQGLLVTFAAIVGVIIGVVAAFPGTYYTCVCIDKLLRVKGGGNGLVTIGWLFLLITVPLGGIAGGYIGIQLAKYLSIS